MLKKYYTEYKIENINKIIVYILLFVIGIVPIITYKYQTASYSPIFGNHSFTTGMKVDIFNFFKSLILYLGTIGVFGLFIYKILSLKEEQKLNKFNVLILGLMCIIALSTAFANYKDIALFGNFDRHEGALAWTCYLFILFILYNIKIEKKYFKLFYFALVPFLVLNTILSVVKLFGVDMLQYPIVQALMGGKGDLTGQLFTTLYHYNFGSGIAAVMFSASFMYLLLEKETKKKIVLLITSVLSFAMLLSLISNGGFITILAMIPLIIVCGLRFTDKKNVLIWSSILLVLNAIVYFVLNSKNSVVYDESMAIFAKLNGISPLIIPAIIVLFIGLLFIMKVTNKKKFFNYIVSISLVVMVVSFGMYSYTLNKQNKEIEAGNTSIIRIEENPMFIKLNEISTDRLNIWTKTINLINEKPILGHGFDTFPYVFLSNDDNGGLSTYGEVIDKPHNWYLSIAYGSGLISLIGIVIIILSIIKGAFYSCVDKVDNKYLYIFSMGSIAYAVQGMFNDSLVGTSIIFWIFAGLSLNLLKNEINE